MACSDRVGGEEERNIFLTAQWRNLLMVNYEIDPADLAAYVPAGTELDQWQGRALISLVGFMFVDCRLRGIGIPLHRNFEELNLRMYIRRRHQGEWRRGVAFIREIVPRAAVAAIARWAYGERYCVRRMRHEIALPGDDGRRTGGDSGCVRYGFRQSGNWHTLAGHIRGMAAWPEPDSVEEFIVEHYWGYTARSATRTTEYQVEHPPWRIWPVTRVDIDESLAACYGPVFGPALAAEPHSALVADGSPISVHRGSVLRLTAHEPAHVERA